MPRNGFTLIELIVTISILAILMTVAIPSFRSLIINNRIATQANDFVSDVSYARAEAVRRNLRVTVCQSNDGATCAAVAIWQNGWIVFTDPAGYGVVDPGEIILRVHGALSSGTTLVAAGFTAGNYFQFLPSGIVSGVIGGTPAAAGAFTLCYTGFNGRILNFNTTGRINVTTMAAACP